MKPIVDTTIKRLSEKKFKIDPIAGDKLSKTTSIMSSSYKRHGTIIETAFLHKLNSFDHIEAWEEKHFKVSRQANTFASQENIKSLDFTKGTLLPYGEEYDTLQIDLIVHDRKHKTLKAYDIKRGFGKHDAGKTISLRRALISTHILLRNYGKTKSITVKSENCEAKLICYYGEKTLPSPLSIDKDEIDKHFKVSILKDIESINQYYKEKLNELIEKI